jgi:hypothetical protein
MKLKDYLKQLQDMTRNIPESLEMEVYTSRDDEGNGYNPVYYSPAVHPSEDLELNISDKHVVVLN